jgi:hypothetical protein
MTRRAQRCSHLNPRDKGHAPACWTFEALCGAELTLCVTKAGKNVHKCSCSKLYRSSPVCHNHEPECEKACARCVELFAEWRAETAATRARLARGEPAHPVRP